MAQSGQNGEANAQQIAFGELLSSLRKIRARSQGQLARDAGVDPSSVSRLEAGTRTPERDMVLKLAEALVLPIPDRDRLLAAAGFRSPALDDPQISELALLLTDPKLSESALQDLRAALRVAIQFARSARDGR